MPIYFADQTLSLDLDGDVALLTLNRPEKRNALNKAMWEALPQAIEAVARNDGAKVLVLTGAGGHFAAGADISEFESVYATRDSTQAYFASVARGMDAVADLAKPVIAQIAGACVGGGMGLALCCDLRLASADAKLGITPGKLGLMYSLADTKRLVDAVGASSAKDMLMTGRILPAPEAHAIRLVDEVHAADDLARAVAEKAGAVAKASQWSARKTKAIIALILQGVPADTPQTEAWLLDAVEGADFIEGRDAFLAKRAPVFPFR